MVLADVQINGRGQYGKKWVSYKGNLFVSFFCNIERVDISMKDFTKINCRIAKKTISNFCKKKITFKLPNDLLVNGKKICGILQERINRDNQKFLVVGIGINIDKSPVILNYPTTNLNEVTGKKVSYKSLVKLLKLNFEKRYFKFLKR